MFSAAFVVQLSWQVVVTFVGSASSQEINGSYSAVPCEEVFHDDAASTLGVGSTCQFLSGHSLEVSRLFVASEGDLHGMWPIWKKATVPSPSPRTE